MDLISTTRISSAELQTLIKDLLEKAKQAGATQAEVAASTDKGFSVTIRMGEVETIEHHQDKGIGMTVYFGHRSGSASTSDLSPDALRATLEKACNIARYTGEDIYSGLADAELMAYHYPNLDLYHPWRITPDHAIELALQCEAKARAIDKRITNSEGASVSTHEHARVYGNSHGFIGHYSATRHTMSCSLIATDGHDMQRDYDYTTARDTVDLKSIDALAKTTASRTIHRLGARKLSTREAPVIFAADEAKGLLASFVSAISGGNLYRKASFLLDHLNKPIFPAQIQISENPHLHKAMGSSPFDSEGVRTQARDIIKDGILMGYVLGSYSARKLNMQSTGNADGVHNLSINTSDKNLAELLKEMGTGLLVTELIGQGINLVTGDYSRGAFGYWVEHGEIQYPVHEITIAGNLKNMFSNIIAVGKDVDHRGNIHTGSIWIDKMMIAGE